MGQTGRFPFFVTRNWGTFRLSPIFPNQSRTVYRSRGRCQAVHAKAERLAARYFTDTPRNARHRGTKGDDRTRSARVCEEQVTPACAKPLAAMN
jgi:hypothetical protein